MPETALCIFLGLALQAHGSGSGNSQSRREGPDRGPHWLGLYRVRNPSAMSKRVLVTGRTIALSAARGKCGG